ncbi:hypothetical protein BH09PSE1_BH09PSE1_09630 [soil metagenome]
MIRTALVAVTAACLFALPAAAQSVELTGPDGARSTLTGEAWAALPRETVAMTIHGQTHAYSGPTLASVLATVGAPLGESLRGPALRSYVLVRAADGYGVVLSLGEIDPAMRPGHVILADADNGAPLPPEDGPVRLVVEGDNRPARSARQVTTIDVRRAE